MEKSPSGATGVPLPLSHVYQQLLFQHKLVPQKKKELVQLIEKCQGSKRFLELQWIHFIDSGGTVSVP